MFDSGITAENLINEIKSEADIAIPIDDEAYITWLNTVEQLLYSEIIHEQCSCEIENAAHNGFIDLSQVGVNDGEDNIRFEDIHAVYADVTQLIKTSFSSGKIFPNTYYKKNNGVGLNTAFDPEKIKIIYFARPELKTISNYAKKNICLPIEFIGTVKAKLRGEAYKAANEDNIAAKWLADYNALLENFKAWVSCREPHFGW